MSTRRRPLTAAAWLPLVGAILAGGCGVPEDEVPRALEQELPAALLEEDSPPSTQPPASQIVSLYLVRRAGDRLTLETVEREVDATDPVAGAIEAVLSPATPEESEQGLSTLFGEGTGLVDTAVADGVLDIRLDSLAGFPADPNSTAFQVAVAMLVCTATTTAPDVSGVLVSIAQEDGSFRPIAVRLPEAPQAAETRPVTCEQFAPFLTGGPGTATTAAP